ncbi:MAG TPA: ATP-dependent DNA ligase [Candidatus Dormibacteraeota bacterium]|nr:ATP-dependent DNA ligase [Candidatus Dormibacteraeota bacterium]
MPPLPLDLEPMLALLRPSLPEGEDWAYEPKWDGFRILAHRHGDQVELISRGARPMTRYFPEVLGAFLELSPSSVVLDGELVIVGPRGLDFDALQLRIHPARSRIDLLSRTTPATYVAFDLLAEGDEDLRPLPLRTRRERLRRLLSGANGTIRLTRSTRDARIALGWFERLEASGIDGVIAKDVSQAYVPGLRAWVKVKRRRTVDCVVMGFRWSSDRSSLGALLLGLYDAAGRLHYVGHTSSFSVAARRQLLERLEPLRTRLPSGSLGRAPGSPSRWSHGRDTSWEAVRPELVCEVAYDRLQAEERFRHAATWLRWRPDKPPHLCTLDQVLPSSAAVTPSAVLEAATE